MNLVAPVQLLVITLLAIELRKAVQSGSQKERGIQDIQVKTENKSQENTSAWITNPVPICQVWRNQMDSLSVLVRRLIGGIAWLHPMLHTTVLFLKLSANLLLKAN